MKRATSHARPSGDADSADWLAKAGRWKPRASDNRIEQIVVDVLLWPGLRWSIIYWVAVIYALGFVVVLIHGPGAQAVARGGLGLALLIHVVGLVWWSLRSRRRASDR